MPKTNNILALDVGEARIGVAFASGAARLASPLITIPNDANLMPALQKLITEHDVDKLVVGLPRGLDGQDTAQTKKIQEFAVTLRQEIQIPVYLMDEAVTSIQAESELKTRGKPYQKGDIDALAATYILEDFLKSQEDS